MKTYMEEKQLYISIVQNAFHSFKYSKQLPMYLMHFGYVTVNLSYVPILQNLSKEKFKDYSSTLKITSKKSA
jgi:hypothetical protein